LAENVWQGVTQPVQPLADGDAVLEKETANLIDDCRAFPGEPRANAMQGLQIELLICLCRNAPRRRALNRFRDSKGIAEVIHMRWPERLGVERGHLPHIGGMAAGSS